MVRPAMPVAALYAASVCFFFVAIDRWTPCVTGGFASDACAARQDDAYDLGLTLTGPHALPLVALLAGYLLLGLGILLAERAVSRHPGRLMFLVALLPWFTGVTIALPAVGGPWATPVMVGLTLITGPFAASSVASPGRRTAWPLAFGAGLVGTSLLVDHFALAPLLSFGYTSWDTNPLTWLPTAIGACLAAFALGRGRTAHATLPHSGYPPAGSVRSQV